MVGAPPLAGPSLGVQTLGSSLRAAQPLPWGSFLGALAHVSEWPPPQGLPRGESPAFWTTIWLAQDSQLSRDVWQIQRAESQMLTQKHRITERLGLAGTSGDPKLSLPTLPPGKSPKSPVKAQARAGAAQEGGSPALFPHKCPLLAPPKLPHSHLQPPTPPRTGSH